MFYNCFLFKYWFLDLDTSFQFYFILEHNCLFNKFMLLKFMFFANFGKNIIELLTVVFLILSLKGEDSCSIVQSKSFG